MKITIGKLRTIIREAAIDPTSSSDLALSITAQLGSPFTAVLYDVARAALILSKGDGNLPMTKRGDVDYEALSSCIVAYIRTKKTNEPGVMSVAYAGADHGYGPFMYDLTLANVKGLVSDREEVSNAARRAWKYYCHNRRDDVKSVDLPPTIAKIDVQDLDRVYSAKGPGPNVSSLKANHEKLVSSSPVDARAFASALEHAGQGWVSDRIGL